MMRTVGICVALLAAMPLAGQNAQPTKPSQLKFGYVDAGDVVEITIEDGELQMELNGKEMPSKRYVRDGDLVKCMNEDGTVVAYLDISGTGGTLRTVPRLPPRLRLGVTLAPVSEALVAQLDLDANESVQVMGVREGGAGDQAGLERFDVITRIGSGPGTRAELSKVLTTKKVGDSLKLTVLRRGKEREVAAKLQAEAQGPSLYDFSGSEWPMKRNLGASKWMNKAVSLYWSDVPAGGSAESAPQRLLDASRNVYDFSAGKDKTNRYFQSGNSPWAENVAKGDSAVVDLTDQLESLERRLERLEKLLKGLDKKLR